MAKALPFHMTMPGPHIARLVQDSLQQNNVNVIPWPARSPDLSPIEHMWDEMDRRLRRQPRVPQTLHAPADMDRYPTGLCATPGPFHETKMCCLHRNQRWTHTLLICKLTFWHVHVFLMKSRIS